MHLIVLTTIILVFEITLSVFAMRKILLIYQNYPL